MLTREKFKWRTIVNYAIFAMAMGYLEAAIVVYLRLLYYPEGFGFPLKIIPMDVAYIEIGREFATIIMLWFAATLFNGRLRERFILFLFIFGVWDLFYYIWLKVLLNWPTHWLEWDILFLIPAPWVGPWLAPALVSAGFIFVTFLLWYKPQKFDGPAFSKNVWLTEIICALLILLSFFWETGDTIQGKIPDYYPWWLFFTAYLIGLGTFLKAYLKRNGS